MSIWRDELMAEAITHLLRNHAVSSKRTGARSAGFDGHNPTRFTAFAREQLDRPAAQRLARFLHRKILIPDGQLLLQYCVSRVPPLPSTINIPLSRPTDGLSSGTATLTGTNSAEQIHRRFLFNQIFKVNGSIGDGGDPDAQLPSYSWWKP